MMLAALDLARRIEAGELTPRAVVELCAEAIAANESKIGAFVTLDLDAARGAADEPRLANMPLRGLPVGIKDIYDTADLPTQYGSPIYSGFRPRANSVPVALVRRAGGLILGKTVTTQFAFMVPAGTRNPRNLAHTPGGSSSGSAAAVAAGMVPIALGSQTAGSVIRPAAFCGVAGYKPSYRLIPTAGMKCLAWHLDTVGSLRSRSCRCRFRRGRDHRSRIARRSHAAGGATNRLRPDPSLAASKRRDAGSGRNRCPGRRSEPALR